MRVSELILPRAVARFSQPSPSLRGGAGHRLDEGDKASDTKKDIRTRNKELDIRLILVLFVTKLSSLLPRVRRRRQTMVFSIAPTAKGVRRGNGEIPRDKNLRI